MPGERRAELAPFRVERRAGRAPFRAGLESSRPTLGRLHLESSLSGDSISSRPRARTSDAQPRGNDLYTSHYNSHRIGCGSSTSPIVIQSSTRGGRPLTSAFLHGVNGLVREARARDRCPVSLQVTRSCPVCVSRQSRRRVTAGATGRECRMNDRIDRSGRPSLDRGGLCSGARPPPARPGRGAIGEHVPENARIPPGLTPRITAGRTGGWETGRERRPPPR